jgi:hypothetical protein
MPAGIGLQLGSPSQEISTAEISGLQRIWFYQIETSGPTDVIIGLSGDDIGYPRQ